MEDQGNDHLSFFHIVQYYEKKLTPKAENHFDGWQVKVGLKYNL
jgi:hypothetical protein